MYELSFDEEKGCLMRRVWGFWTMEIAQRYTADLEAITRRIKAQRSKFDVFSEATGMSPQATDVGAILAQTMSELATACGGRIAIVSGAQLTKMQLLRLYPLPSLRAFMDEQAAWDWLSE